MKKTRTPTIYDERYIKLIEKLVADRKAAGLTQHDMAKALGFSQSDISKIENRERRLDIIELEDWQNFVKMNSK